MQSEWSEAVLGRSGGECEAVLSWQVLVALAKGVADDDDAEEEESRSTAMEQAPGSAEVSATCLRADTAVEEGWWWCWCVCVCVCVQRAWCSEMGSLV